MPAETCRHSFSKEDNTMSGEHALKYKAKLEELEQCIEVIAEEGSKLLSYGEYIELLKLQLEVQKEIYRMEVIS